MKLTYKIDSETLQDVINISTGLFYPLTGFMNAKDYNRVVKEMLLTNGKIWSIPVSLDVDADTYQKALQSTELHLIYNTDVVAKVDIEDCFLCDDSDVNFVFGTNDRNHPGVNKELSRHKFRIGGKVHLIDKSLTEGSLNPEKTRKIFKERNWNTIVGFQTRNPLHKAHEYLLRIGLEICDGLFINPLLGWKKTGDFSESAVTNSYHYQIHNFFPPKRVYFEGLLTQMRYAGPREAIFHALIRRNAGCTHFIIGRDHAGVGSFYGKYDAHKLAFQTIQKHDLGIHLLLLKGPCYCKKCKQIVTENSCGHPENEIIEISGTEIRRLLSLGQRPDEIMMRPEISDIIIKLGSEMFI